MIANNPQFFIQKLFLKTASITLVVIFWSFLPSLAQETQKNETIVIDEQDRGRTFQGIGAISAGGSSRLLYDYPEPERRQILDFLFKPDYGANIQILKAEIGGDMNSTSGSEASHMRSRDEVNCNRGYEWWLMKEAKKRNPDIKLAGLAWGAPGWMGEFWSQANIDYHLEWLKCADQHGLQIDYMGGWNESGWDADWYIAWDKALEEQYPNIKLVAADQAYPANWKVATAMKSNQTFNNVVDIIGQHNPCGSRRNAHYQGCPVIDDALNSKKPLWASEFSSLSHNIGAIPIARALNRAYIDGKVTAQMTWSAVSAWYANLPIADTGLMLAEWPWSGYYQVGKSIWTYAHTTQFTEPGWQYIDSASGMMESGASYVTLKSPDKEDYTTVIETMDMNLEQTVSFSVSGGLPAGKQVHVWTSDLRTDNSDNHFVHTETVQPQEGALTLTLQPGHLYTLSTTTGQSKGDARPEGDLAERMELPYSEDFEGYGAGKLARYYSDINGAFETAPCGGAREGSCYRQVVSTKPSFWHGPDMPPTTVIGDPRWWGDYKVSADVMLEKEGYIELLGRIDGVRGDKFVSAYHLQITDEGRWRLYSENAEGSNTELTSGNHSFSPGSWHNIALHFKNNKIRIIIDNTRVADVNDERHRTGQIGLRTSKWNRAQFDNVQVTPIKPWPNFVPDTQMTATATSAHTENANGYTYPASAAVDDRPETHWRSEWDPLASIPQSITIDLGAVRNVQGLTYQPHISNNWAAKNNGSPITAYNIYISKDGQDFKRIASGDWPGTLAVTKVATWKRIRKARYIRLEATEGGKGGVTAGEINVIIAE